VATISYRHRLPWANKRKRHVATLAGDQWNRCGKDIMPFVSAARAKKHYERPADAVSVPNALAHPGG
jgi:hypothetical protein